MVNLHILKAMASLMDGSEIFDLKKIGDNIYFTTYNKEKTGNESWIFNTKTLIVHKPR